MDVSPVKARARPPIVDGLFYPAEKEPLAALVDELLARSPVPAGDAFAVISPHAAYGYAGEVMAAAFRALAGRSLRTIVILGPTHRDSPDALFLPASGVFTTPLADVPVDEAAVEALLRSDGLFRCDDIPHMEEHCLEVQVPFLVRLFPEAAILPILMGSQSLAAVDALCASLGSLAGSARGDLAVVATANMASYMTGRDVAEENAALERLIAGGNWRGILSARREGRISACGAGAIAAVLSLAGSQARVELLARASSLGKDEETERAVHYAAVGIWNGPRPL